MLVLSRRVSEKVLFPNLGITVEVTRIKGNTVRLGVDAPREVRVIRAELDEGPEHPPVDPSCPSSDSYDIRKLSSFERSKRDREREIQENLDTVSLAVQLAQNQLRQGLGSHAEEALENAIECLRELEETLSGGVERSDEMACVRESSNGYQVGKVDQKKADQKPDQLVASTACLQRQQEVKRLIDLLETEFRSWSQ